MVKTKTQKRKSTKTSKKTTKTTKKKLHASKGVHKHKKRTALSKHTKSKHKKSKPLSVVQKASVLVLLLIAGFIFLSLYQKYVPQETVVAVVNGEKITMPQLQLAMQGNSGSQKAFLESALIPNVLLRQEAEKKGIKVHDQEITIYLRQQGITLETYLGLAKKQGLSEEQAKEYVKELVMVLKVVEQVIKPASVTDENILSFYQANPEAFQGKSFDGVREDIKKHLAVQQLAKQVDEYLVVLSKDANIKIQLDALDKE
jgi:hypothetical protein